MEKIEKVKTGIKNLDKLTGGGFPGKTVILVSGTAGTGKTLFGLNFVLEGARNNEKCCFISLNEGKEELLRACEGIETLKDAQKYLGKTLDIKNVTMGESIDARQFTEIFSSYPNVDRLVIDNMNKLLLFAENKKDYRVQLSKLVRYLKERVKCSLLICETEDDKRNGGSLVDTGMGESFECDGVLLLSFLEFEEKPMRTLEIYKMRYADVEARVPHDLRIGAKEGFKLTDKYLA